MNIFDLMLGNTIIPVGEDGVRRGGNYNLMNQYQKDVDEANEYVYWWMTDQEVRDTISEMRKEYMHEKGWSKDKTFKSKLILPESAVLKLPKYMINDGKKIHEWVKEFHPYLDLSHHC